MEQGFRTGRTKIDWTPGLLAALAGAAAGVLFLGALENGFVWDDYSYLVNNHHLRMDWRDYLKWAFTTTYASKYLHPLTWLSHRLDHALWGLNPLGHHLASVVIHAANTSLVVVLTFLLADKAAGQRARSLATGLIAGLFFGLHPLRVEPVAWVAGRKDLLCGLFFLVSLVGYLRYVEEGGIRNYLLSLVAFSLGFLAKPVAASLPLVLLIMDLYPLGRRWFEPSTPAGRNALLDKVPFFFLAALGVVFNVLSQQPGRALVSMKLLGPWAGGFPGHRVLVPVRGLFFYIEKSLWPVNLAPLYPYPGGPGVEHLVCGALFVGLAAALFRLRKSAPWLAALGASYLAMLLPVSPIRLAAADRFSYLPGVALGVLFGLGGAWAWFKSPRKARPALAAAFLLVFALLFRATWAQVKIWRDGLRLWNHEIALFGERVPVAYNHRGVAYSREGLPEKALEDFDRAIALDPREPSAYGNRGLQYYKKGRVERALEDFEKAVSLDPFDPGVYNNRGLAYAEKGLYDRALEDYDRALDLRPLDVEALTNRGAALAMKGSTDKALRDYDRALAIDPGYGKAYNNRGLLYARKGLHGRALRDYHRAIELLPDYAPAYNNRGLAYLKKGFVTGALDDFDRAVALDPDFAPAYNNRGVARAKRKLYDPAIEDYTRAIELDPEYGPAYYNRAISLARKGLVDQAIEDYTRALGLMPDNPSAYYNRGNAYLKKGSLEEAVGDYTRAIELRPDHAPSYNNRGWAYFKLGYTDRALSDYTRAISLDENYGTALFNRGLAYREKGIVAKARRDFKSACEAGNEEGCKRLGRY